MLKRKNKYYFLFLFLINCIRCSFFRKFYKQLPSEEIANLGIYSPVIGINKKQCLFSQKNFYENNIRLIYQLLLHNKYIKGVHLNTEQIKILHQNLEENKKRILLIDYISSGQDEKDNKTFKNSFLAFFLSLYIIDKSLKKEKNRKYSNIDNDDGDSDNE